MFTDIVFPKNNEHEFIAMAKKLGYSKLCFVYDDPEKIKEARKKYKDNSLIIFGVIGTYRTIPKVRNTADLVIVESSDSDRKLLENSEEIILVNVEETKKSDFMHQRASGLNHIMCSLAHKNDITLAFSFSKILNAPKRAELLGRIKQNIKLCRKYKVKTRIASFAETPYEMRSPRDLIDFFSNLGMHQGDAKKSLIF